MKFFNRPGFYLSLISNSISLTKKRNFLSCPPFLCSVATLILVFFTGTLSVSAKAQSVEQNTGKCQSSFTGLSKELENLLTQNRGTKPLSDVIQDIDTLIKNKKVNPNEAFMWASLRKETALITHLKEKYNYALDSHAIIEYAFNKDISKKEVDNLIKWGGANYEPYEFKEGVFLNEVFIQTATEKNLEISTHLIENHGVNVNEAFLHIAHRGDVETATYLVDNHGADINYRPPSDNRGISYYLATNNLSHLTKLLYTTIDLNPLTIAVKLGHQDFVKYLLQEGKEIFSKTADSTFLEAIKKENKDMAKALIELGLLQNPYNTLITAMEILRETPNTNRSQELADFLIEETLKEVERIPIQRIDEDWRLTGALFLAAAKNLKDKAELLVELGIYKPIELYDQVYKKTIYRVNPVLSFSVVYAVKHGNIDLAIYLIKQEEKPSGEGGLIAALQKGNGEVIRFYLFETKFNLEEYYNHTSYYDLLMRELVNIALRGEIDILKDFFEAGYNNKVFLNIILAELVLNSRLSETELVEVIDFLISQGANLEGHAKMSETYKDLEAQFETGWTALHLAVDLNKALVVDKLLEHKADPNARDKKNQTPLHLINIITTNPKIVQALIEHGADLKAKDKKHRTPVSRAKSYREQYLKNNQGPYPTSTPASFDNAIMILLETKNQLDLPIYADNRYSDSTRAQKPVYYTPLGLAIKKGDIRLVNALLELRAKIHTRVVDNNNSPFVRTHLDYAVHRYAKSIGNPADYQGAHYEKNPSTHSHQTKHIVDILIQKSDPKYRSPVGESDLMIVARGGTVDQVEFLIAQGHDIHAKDKEGENVADYALFNEDPGVLNTLYQKGAKITEESLLHYVILRLSGLGLPLPLRQMEIILEGSFDINTIMKSSSLLHLATFYLDTKGVEFLLKNGAKLDIKTQGRPFIGENKTPQDLLNERKELYKNPKNNETKKKLQQANQIQTLFNQHK